MNSDKTIIEKLNLTKYSSRLVMGVPEDMEDFKGLEHDATIQKEKYDLLFLFIYSLEKFAEYIKLLVERDLVMDKGYVFFAYPKKNNPTYKEYIERDRFIEAANMDEEGYISGSILKFSRMVSLNDVFTVVGLKAAEKKTKKAESTKKSQCVDDYIVHIDDIREHLKNNEAILKTYNELTYGYQKDWARYVYSAKRKETQEKRLLEMETILGEGYKSMDLYRRKNK
ncbi:YdeI/OmpD-associated family protein [Bacillus tianshenii]|uniref:YdeI/OmpD-associated family protein n=1 Tax=Sutcliffiella tianshenii TaxID=1463404 RepID=UPI001CD4D493|nr:YdeI/OmpD-associated family protein [Bacillus tianshenii]MCA1321953.1 YdeI/OmpD-associated family protein [Bacillus tianshenii]